MNIFTQLVKQYNTLSIYAKFYVKIYKGTLLSFWSLFRRILTAILCDVVAVIKLILARKIKDTLQRVTAHRVNNSRYVENFFWYTVLNRRTQCTLMHGRMWKNDSYDVHTVVSTCLVQKIISALCLSFLLQLHATMSRMNVLYMYLKNTLFYEFWRK